MTPESLLNAHHKEEYPPMHTAEHILNRAMMRLFHTGRSISAHIERKKSKMDFALDVAPTDEDIRRIAEEVNRVIRLHLPVTVEFITQAEASGQFDMNRLPEGASDIVRVVHVGDYDACLCVGKHVQNTSEIGTFVISSHSYEGGVLRLRFKLLGADKMS